MQKKYKVAFLFIVALLTMLMSRCVETDPDSDKDGVLDHTDKCPLLKGPAANDGCPVVPPIKKVHLYLDNSASMNGYYRDLTEYKTVLSDLAVKVDKEITPVDISFIAHATLPYKNSIADFNTALATTPMAAQKSSELHQMIKSVATRNADNDVSLLVSDCILSFPDSAVKANPEINRNNAPGTLKNNIYATFADLRKKGFAVSFYAFKSSFFGVYYDYQNHKTVLNGAVRPFYIWVIAKQSVLLDFDAKLAQISSFKPERELHFGLISTPIRQYAILSELEHRGNWSKDDSGLSDVDISKEQPLRAALALDLNNLPPYARNIKYLQSNLIMGQGNCTGNFDVKEKKELRNTRLHSQNEIQTFNTASHILFMNINEMPLPQARIRFSLPLKYDTWYKEWSTMDDRSAQQQANKTFALEYLIRGVNEAYEIPNKNYLDFSLSISK